MLTKRYITIIILLLAALAGTSYAGTVTMAWDTYTDDADGFYLYASKTSNVEAIEANRIATITNIASGSATIDLSPGRWYFTATAFKNDPIEGVIESVKSNEPTGIVKPFTIRLEIK